MTRTISPSDALIDCPTCGGSGFSGLGSGYGDVCSECGGQRQIPEDAADERNTAHSPSDERNTATISPSDTLLELAERCEAATGPDGELDFLIWAALNGVSEITYPTEGHPMTPGKGGRVEGRGPDGEWHLYGWIDPGEVARNWQPYRGNAYLPYTASVDVALTLVPEGADVALQSHGGPGPMALVTPNERFCRASTLPLAICAAALRARAAQ